MTTTTTMRPPTASAVSTPSRTTPYRQSFARVVRSEWIKIRTLRSTWIGMAAVLVVLVGFGAIAAAVSSGSVVALDEAGQGGPSFAGGDPLSTVLTGANFAVLLIGVLGCLAGAREYGSRMIAATASAVPRRWQIVLSKALVYIAVALPTALIGVLGAFAVGMGILSAGDAATVSLGDSGVLTSVLGMAGYITAVGVIGLGLGVLLRSVAGSIGAIVGGVLLLPALAGALLPDSWDSILQFLPSEAAAGFTVVMSSGADVLSAGAGAAVLLAWVVAVLAGAAAVIGRRDV